MKTVSTFVFSFIIFVWVPSLIKMESSYMPLPPSNMIRIPFGNINGGLREMMPAFQGMPSRVQVSKPLQDTFQPFLQISPQGSSQTTPQSIQPENGVSTANRFSHNIAQYATPDKNSEPAYSDQTGFVNQQFQPLNSFLQKPSFQEKQGLQTSPIQQRFRDLDQYNFLRGSMQYNALEPLQNTASEQSQAIEGNPIAVIPKGAPGSQQSGQRFRDQPEKIQFASRAGDQQTQLVPRQRYSPDTYDETRQTSSNEKNYGVHRQSREPDTPKLDGTRFEFSPVERKDSQYKSDQTPSIQTKRQDVSTLSVENRQFHVRPPSNVQSDQQLWSSNLYTPNGFSSSNSLGEDQVGRQEYSLGLKQNSSFSDQQTLPLKFSERSLPMLNHINEPLGEQWFSPYGTQPAPKFDYHGGVERVQQSPLFGIQQVPSSRTLQPAQYGEQEKLSIGFQDISRTGELPTIGELKEPHIVIPQQYKAQKTPSSLDVTLSQYPPIYEQGSLDGINTPQFKSQLPPSLELPTGSHALESIPIIELEESPFRGLQPQYIGRTMQLSQAAPRSQSTPFNIQPLLGQRAPRYEEPKGPPFRLHMSDHDPPTLDGRQEITFEEPQLQLHTERQVPLQSGTRSQATQVQASLGQRAPSLQLRNGLRDHELSFRVQQQQYPSQYVSLLQTVPLSQNNEETPFGETRDYTFQGPPRTLETNLLKQSQQSPFRGQQVPLYGQQQETPFELQGSPRKLEIMPLKTMQHPQFDALRESFEKNLLRDKQMVNSQQRSYDEPEPISKLAPSIEESNRMPFWRRPDTMFNVQPSSHTEATQRSDLPFSTPVEQMREQQVNWLGQLRNPWSGQDQHELSLSSAQGELPIRQIPFESDAPSSLQSKVTPEFLMGKSRGFSPGVTRDMQMGVRLIHPEGLTTEFRDEPPTRSLLPYLSLIDKSHQPLTKSVVVIQPIERPLGTLGNLSRRPELLHRSTHSDDFEEDQVLLSQRFPSRQFIQLQEPNQHAHNFEEKQFGNMQMEQPSNGRPRQLVLPSEYQQRTQRILQTDQQTTSTLEHDLDRPWTVVDDQQRSMRISMTQEFSKELDPRQRMKQLESSVEPELEVEHRKQTYDGARALTQNTATEEEQPKPKIRLQIFFESKCPDSKRFFGNQLTPMMDKIGDYIELELHPYGKATTNQTTGEFKCQHGPSECALNKIDACGIARLNEGTEQTLFVNCMFENSNIPQAVAGQYCCDQHKLDWTKEVQPCSEGTEGTELHRKHGEETHSLNPPVTWVPVIILNNKRGDEEYQKILTNYVFQETCSQLTKMNNRPPGC